MPETQTISTQSLNLLDESFDLKKSYNYHLSILTDGESLSFSVLDTNTNKYLALQTGPHTLSTGKKILLFGETAEELPFKSITCAIAHPKFTLVPSALFEEENKSSLLGFNHPIEINEKIYVDALGNIDAKNIFTIPDTLVSSIRKQYVNARFIHTSTAFIETLLIQNKNNTDKKVFANFHTSYFEIVILDGRNLLFSNAFRHKTPEDIAYYILFVYEQLGLNPEETELVLSGEIEKAAKEHALLYHYIHHVKFASLPEGFQYSYKFDEVPAHTFWTIFTLYHISP